MKRAGLWAFGIGMFCIVGFLTVKQGYPVPPKCSVATLTGTYLFDGISYVVSGFPPTVDVYIAVAGRAIYNRDGTSATLARLTVNGVAQPDSHATGVYTVDTDCKGAETLTDEAPPHETHEYVTIISADGNEIHFVGIDPGAVRALVARRVGR